VIAAPSGELAWVRGTGRAYAARWVDAATDSSPDDTIVGMRNPTLPARIGTIAVPQDDVSATTWRWANASLPRYLLDHSIRSFCWGAAIADREDWAFDRRILWTAALFHDLGLARLTQNTMCFEVEGAEIARRFLERHGMSALDADRAAIAIILHMQPDVTLDDGVESVLLDRATGVDVRGADIAVVDGVRDDVVAAYPRRGFDRLFLRAMTREARARRTCQSAAFVRRAAATDWPARTPWAGTD
jgi:HD domain